MNYSLGGSLFLARMIAHDGNEKVSYAGRAYVAKRGELLAIYCLE